MPLRAQAAAVAAKPANLQVYGKPEVASHYASLDDLTACERHLFESYLRPGLAILDMGVGGGRTTPYLSQKASHYVGLDYSEEMVRLCRGKVPHLEFLGADASDLSRFPDASFDAIIFSFNGLDYILPTEKRGECVRECERVLRAGGVFIFSSHNPRSVFVRPSWDPAILRALARQWFPRSGLGFTLLLSSLTIGKSIHALLRALAGSVTRIVRRIPTTTFWRGEGCLFDSAHGGLITHYWTARHAIAEVSSFGLQLKAQLGEDYPRPSHEFITDWYYYVFTKAEAVRESCA
jgi:ubiquinone/menaquinone biosynthesis C-methylase UbiE